jgi:hypothetical protein
VTVRLTHLDFLCREPSYLASPVSPTQRSCNAGRRGSRMARACPHRGTPTSRLDPCPRPRWLRARSYSRMA